MSRLFILGPRRPPRRACAAGPIGPSGSLRAGRGCPHRLGYAGGLIWRPIRRSGRSPAFHCVGRALARDGTPHAGNDAGESVRAWRAQGCLAGSGQATKAHRAAKPITSEEGSMSALVQVALIGDYDETVTAHRAIPLALDLAATAVGCTVALDWIATPELEHNTQQLANYGAIWCVPGSPYASMDGALNAIRYAREQGVPFLGTC